MNTERRNMLTFRIAELAFTVNPRALRERLISLFDEYPELRPPSENIGIISDAMRRHIEDHSTDSATWRTQAEYLLDSGATEIESLQRDRRKLSEDYEKLENEYDILAAREKRVREGDVSP